jgi:hypothetical protein
MEFYKGFQHWRKEKRRRTGRAAHREMFSSCVADSIDKCAFQLLHLFYDRFGGNLK